MDTDLETCFARDVSRTTTVGRQVLIEQDRKLHILKRMFDFETRLPGQAIQKNVTGQTAIVFDIDGTIAINTGRHPFDWSRVMEDKVDVVVNEFRRCLKAAGHEIIICTARDGSCEEATKTWLKQNGVEHHRFYIRAAGDSRPDYVVKEEFWREINKTYDIIALVDDRDQVVRHARSLGLKVFQVAYGDF